MRSPNLVSSVGTRSRLGSEGLVLAEVNRSHPISSNRRTTPLIMSPTRSLNSVKIRSFFRPPDLLHKGLLGRLGGDSGRNRTGVTSTSTSSPSCASALMRRASNTEIWSCCGRHFFPKREVLQTTLMSPVFVSTTQRRSRAGPTAFLGGGRQGLDHGGDQDLAADPLLAFPEFDYCQKSAFISSLLSPYGEIKKPVDPGSPTLRAGPVQQYIFNNGDILADPGKSSSGKWRIKIPLDFPARPPKSRCFHETLQMPLYVRGRRVLRRRLRGAVLRLFWTPSPRRFNDRSSPIFRCRTEFCRNSMSMPNYMAATRAIFTITPTSCAGTSWS